MKTIQDALLSSLSRHRDRVAVRAEAGDLTYGMLDIVSDGLVRRIFDNKIAPLSRVVLFSSDPAAIIPAIIAVLKARCVFSILDQRYPPKVFSQVLQELSPALILADQPGSPLLSVSKVPVLPISSADYADHGARAALELPPPSPDDPIYVFFTSGTTGRPKGIVGRNRGLIHFLEWEIKELSLDGDCVASQLTSPMHDPFLRDVFAPLLSGGSVALPGDRNGLLMPAAMREYLNRFKVALVHCTPGIFRILADSGLRDKDVPSLRYVLSAGEELRSADIRPFFKAGNKNIKLYNLYGPTETTLAKLSHLVTEADISGQVVPVGKPIPGAKVLILDAKMKRLPPGKIGEIYIGTPYMSLGYLGRESFSEKFVRYTLGERASVFFRTGDLGRSRPDGVIEFLGRSDTQVKVRGYRVELSAVENALRTVKNVQDAVVVAQLDPRGERYLAGFVVSRERLSFESVIDELSLVLPEYMIPSKFLQLSAIPLTKNHKVDRSALELLSCGQGQDYKRTGLTEKELQLLDIWRGVLGRNDFGADDDFFLSGGHSLSAISLAAALGERFRFAATPAFVFRHRTIREQARNLSGVRKELPSPTLAGALPSVYPATVTQQNIYSAHLLDPVKTAYNITECVMIDGPLDVERLETALNKVILRHEALRSGFVQTDTGLYGEVSPSCRVDLAVERVKRSSLPALVTGFSRPFDLAKPPLIRAKVLSFGKNGHLLVYDVHHIVFDGFSTHVLVSDLAKAYRGEALAPLEKDISAYASEFHKNASACDTGNPRTAERLFARGYMELPRDFKENVGISFEGGVLRRKLRPSDLGVLRALSEECRVTPFSAVFAVFNVLIQKYCNSPATTIAVPVSVRETGVAQAPVGPFIRIIPVCSEPPPDTTFLGLLKEVSNDFLTALDRPSGYHGPDALNVLFNYHGLSLPDFDAGDVVFKPQPFKYRRDVSRYALSVDVIEENDGLDIIFEYSSKIFERGTIDRLADHFIYSLEQLASDPNEKICDFSPITPPERAVILKKYAGRRTHPSKVGLLGRIYEQALKFPQKSAVINTDGGWTYSELWGKVQLLRNSLSMTGCVKGDRVGVFMERSPETLASVLAVFSSGAVYVPLDPAYPHDYLQYVIKQSGLKSIFCDDKTRVLLAGFNCEGETSLIDAKEVLSAGGRAADVCQDPIPDISPVDLAYIMYTSGSTGVPKGVMVSHGNLLNFLSWAVRECSLSSKDRTCLVTSMAFDISLFEMLAPLVCGGAVAVAPASAVKDVVGLLAFVERAGVTIWHSVPALIAQAMMAFDFSRFSGLYRIRLVAVGGEAWTYDLARDIRRHLPKAAIINLYGPTEATIWVSSYKVPDKCRGNGVIPVGSPCDNTSVLVLDRNLNLCPVGVTGEICLSGKSVSPGYYNDAEKTAAAFVKHPRWQDTIYKTGDFGFFRGDGNIEYLGRRDSLIKVNGYRIETGQIENTVKQVPGITDAAVIGQACGTGTTLVCYYSPDSGVPGGAIESALREKLPPYMVPSVYQGLERIPRMPNGKTDRKSLERLLPSGTPRQNGRTRPATDTEEILLSLWKELLPSGQFGLEDAFFSSGGNSLLLTKMFFRLERIFPGVLNIADLFTYPSIEKLAGYIDSGLSTETGKRIPRCCGDKSSRDVAVIGIGIDLPGCSNLDEFTAALSAGRDFIGEFPVSRQADISAVPVRGGGIRKFHAGAYLDRIDLFDHHFFRMTPKEASLVDPAQRLLLETSYHALEDSGYGGKILSGKRVGVFVGHSGDFSDSYKQVLDSVAPQLGRESLVRNISSMAAGRLSYFLDLRGVAVVVDTACSSALVAVYMACRALRSGECEMAVVSAAKIRTTPWEEPDFIGIHSPGGRSRSFADDADGIGRGEGVISVVLKPLAAALADGDHVEAVIKGGALNQDGTGIGLTAPNVVSQKQVILDAWSDALVDPLTVRYVEAHGTGTTLGDVIEAEGICRAFTTYTDRKKFCGIGSVKSNLGHLDNASGLLAFLKALLSVKNGRMFPSLHVKTPNRKIPFDSMPVYIVDRLIPWERGDSPRRAGVSAFGLSGTNAHLVVEEPPSSPVQPRSESSSGFLFTVSAQKKEQIEILLKAYCDLIRQSADISIADLCWTAASGRMHLPVRLAILVHSREEMLFKLEDLIANGFWGMAAERMDSIGVWFTVGAGVEGKDRVFPSGLAKYYVSGGDVDWQEIFEKPFPKRIRLPLYPFERIRCWPEQLLAVSPSGTWLMEKEKLHGGSAVYRTGWNPAEHWILGEHLVGGKPTAVGTAFIELMGRIAESETGTYKIIMRNVSFLQPLAIDIGEALTVAARVEPSGPGFKVSVCGKPPKGVEEFIYAQGFIEPNTVSQPAPLDIPGVRARCASELPGYSDTPALVTGPRWKTREKISAGKGEWLVELRLPEMFAQESGDYLFHPAMMDAAVNTMTQRLGDGLYLPLHYRKITIFDKLPASIVCHIAQSGMESADGSAEMLSFDVIIADTSGRVLVVADAYTVKRARSFERTREKYHGVVWAVKPQLPEPGGRLLHVIILSDGSASSISLENAFKDMAPATGVSYWESCPEKRASSWKALIDGIRCKSVLVVDLLTVGDVSNCANLEEMKERVSRGILASHEFVKMLAKRADIEKAVFASVTKYSCKVGPSDAKPVPENAMLNAFSAVLRQELPWLSGCSVDVDDATPAASVAGFLLANSVIGSYAFRNGVLHEKKLEPIVTGPQAYAPKEVFKNKHVLITGAGGGLGSHFAAALSGIEGVRLSLLSRGDWHLPSVGKGGGRYRSAKNAKASVIINELMRKEVRIKPLIADVSDMAGLERALAEARAQHGPVQVVIHAAGVPGKGMSINKTGEGILNVLNPKIAGAFNLRRALTGDPVERMVFFSSVNSLAGGKGQSDYAAANAFLDAAAEAWDSEERRCIAINWPAWREIGMAAEFGADGLDQLFLPVSKNSGVDDFWNVLALPRTQVTVGSINHEYYLRHEIEIPFRIPLLDGGLSAGPVRAGIKPGDKDAKLLGEDLWSETEKSICRTIYEVLGIKEIDITEKFFDMGMDSIQATGIVRSLSAVFPGHIDVTDIFAYPTVKDLAQAIASRYAPISGAPAGDVCPIDKLVDNLMDGEIDPEEAERILREDIS